MTLALTGQSQNAQERDRSEAITRSRWALVNRLTDAAHEARCAHSVRGPSKPLHRVRSDGVAGLVTR